MGLEDAIDLLKDLERHRSQLEAYRGNPQISEAALDGIVGRLDQAHEALNRLPGKAGQALTSNEWLMSIRSRINIPGGTCEFDLPAYYAWQQREPEQRRADLGRWLATMRPLAHAIAVLLGGVVAARPMSAQTVQPVNTSRDIMLDDIRFE